MNEGITDVWLPRMLFVLSLGLALVLAGAALVAPWLGPEIEHPLTALYAHDVTVRRVSLFSAVGLAVTAFVFFRPKPTPTADKKPPATNVAGA
jgi:hypothetical protein